MSALEVGLVAADAGRTYAQDADLRTNLLSAMKVARNHWMVTDPDKQMRGAIASVMQNCSADDKERILLELRVLSAVSAATTGIPVDFGNLDMPENPIGLLGLWTESEQ